MTLGKTHDTLSKTSDFLSLLVMKSEGISDFGMLKQTDLVELCKFIVVISSGCFL